MKRLLREPLLHFAVLGVLLFALHARFGSVEEGAEPLRIGAAELHWLEQIWTRQWRRPPTLDEKRGLLVELLKEELLSREARELGLDRDDTVVRRRLAQKVEFLVQDTLRPAEPGEALLRRYYEAHASDFVRPARLSFEQVLFSAVRRDDAEGDAQRRLAELATGRTGGSHGIEGDASLLTASVESLDERAVAAQFGDDFARAVFAASGDSWFGPLRSPFGAHLVRVTGRIPAEQRSFEDARAEVTSAWRASAEAEAAARYFDDLLARYPLRVDEKTSGLLAGIDGAQLRQAGASGEMEASR